MQRGKFGKLLELLVIVGVVLGLRALSSADPLGSVTGTITAKGGTAIFGASVTLSG